MRARRLCLACGHADHDGEPGCGHLPLERIVAGPPGTDSAAQWWEARMQQRDREAWAEIAAVRMPGADARKRQWRAMISWAVRAGREFVVHRA